MPADNPGADTRPRFREIAATVGWVVSYAWNTHKPLFLAAVFLALSRSTVAAGLALAIRGLLNASVAELDAGSARLVPLVPWLAMGLTFALIEVLAPIAARHTQRRLGEALQLRATSEMFAHTSDLDAAQVEEAGREGVLERARDGSARQLTRLVMDLLNVGMELVQGISLAAVLLHVEPLALAFVIPAAALYLVSEWRASQAQEAEGPSRNLRQRWARYFTTLLSSDRAANEVRLLSLAPPLVERYRSLTEQLEQESYAETRRQLRASAVFNTATTLIFYACLAIVASRAITGRLTVGDVAVFAAASSRLRSTLSHLVTSTTRVLAAAVAAASVRAFLAVTPRRPSRPGSGFVPWYAEIAVEDVWFTYPGAPRPALAGVSLQLRRGEIVAISGPNGAGKTTLLKLLAGFYPPERGRILVDGRNLDDWPIEEYREGVALVTQDSPKFEASARDNIAYGRWKTLGANPELAEQAVAGTALDDLVRTLPRGYDTTLGRLFGEQDLSSGQWQQVVIARAYARGAPLWLLDEPTAHLDDAAEQDFLARLRLIAADRMIVMVTHRSKPLAAADRVIVMQRGVLGQAGRVGRVGQVG